MPDPKQTIDEQLAAKQAKSPGASAPGEAPEHAPTADGDAPESVIEPGHGDGAAELEGDLDELVAVAQQRDEYLALAQRTQADFENYRKRVARDSALAQERGVARLAKELLPALDNLDRALEEAGGAGESGRDGESGSDGESGREREDALLDGVRLVRSELSASLARVGVEAFSPLGEPFDPAVHEAMATVPAPEEGSGSGTVVEVYQPGYRLGESIIRPARVVVAA